MQRSLQVPRSLWPIFLPLTLAIVAAILLADVVRAGVGGLAGDDPIAHAKAVASTPADDSRRPLPTPAAVAPEPRPRAVALATLPGPVTARREGAKAACIHGTVAYRSGNGWEQGLANDVPLRCRSDSN